MFDGWWIDSYGIASHGIASHGIDSYGIEWDEMGLSSEWPSKCSSPRL